MMRTQRSFRWRFSFKKPSFVSVASSAVSSGKGSSYLAMNFWWLLASSLETPYTLSPGARKPDHSSLMPQASFVQPGVSSFG